MLPVATKEGVVTPFSDALFTATSAVCVTGLVVHDTATYWSNFGQFIIVELLGAAALFPVFWQEFGLVKGLWYALFHSISAFCNAGFDLMGIKEPFSSLVDYADNPVVSVAIPLLIIIGGIGFLTWDDIRTNRLHITRYRMQSKVILVVTGSLILLPGIYFFLFEFAREPVGKRLLLSFFQAVTPRTAGFNTADLTAMSESGQTIITMLMLIGGSPGSTAGGMKTTTLAVLLANALAVFRRNEYPQFFNRRISKETISQAATIFAMYLGLFLLGGMAICCVEDISLEAALFETASALGTVGLTLGVTPGLGGVSRLILIFLMYFGRVGGLTLIYAVLPGPDYAGALLFFFANGKAARVDLTAYKTTSNRRKLTGAYSDKAPLACIRRLDTDCELAVYSTEPRALIFHTALLAPKTTRTTQGVAVMTLKPKYQLETVKALEDTPITNQSRYRVRSLPAAGALLREEDSEERQMDLLD